MEQWWKLKYELPPHKAHTGKPALDQRQIVTDRLWLQRKDTPWRDIPERYGNDQTISSRF